MFESLYKKTLLFLEADDDSITNANKPEDDENDQEEEESITSAGTEEQPDTEDESDVEEDDPDATYDDEEEDYDESDVEEADEDYTPEDEEVASPPTPEEEELIDLTNLLVKALKFNPTKEFRAYINMPRFFNLSSKNKILLIKSSINQHPERLMRESNILLEADMDDDFGDSGDEGGGTVTLKDLDKYDILKLIIKALNINPNIMSYTIGKIPHKVDSSNYKEIANMIKQVLF